ncbi:cation diffusion facilitator family transporter [Tuberibacillus calidus]|uniref:cation diffusion facilitator family transporter n=1 Tax=Tuberibacillus calidus TaxID=340097 RepID=UPI00042416B0|nr:cation diffusion facilitator family transporter [Tuberibacillus calidus]
MTTAQKKHGWLAAWISLISNFILTVVKVVVGSLFSSTALIADGVHNGGDFIASIATISSMKLANQPADKEHPYGHGKAEDIATGIVSLILAFAGIYLIYESMVALFHPASEASLWALSAALVSLLWKLGLYLYTIRVGKRLDSKSLIATAYDHLADVWASLAAVIGIGFAKVGDVFDLSYAVYGDPIAGIIVSLLILKVAYEMGIQAINVLMESSVSEEKQKFYQDLILSFPEVKRIDLLRAREHGNYILIDIRIGVRGDMTIQEGHDITRKIRDAIKKEDPKVEEVLIHLNPWYPGEGH